MSRFETKRREWTEEQLYAYGLLLLSYRARSEQELATRFTRRGAEPELTSTVAARLREEGLLDDAVFARNWVDSRRRASPRGTRLLSSELRAKGVPREVVDAVLADTSDEQALARQAAEKKARAWQTEPAEVLVERLRQFLVRRGFSFDVAVDVARAVVREGQPR